MKRIIQVWIGILSLSSVALLAQSGRGASPSEDGGIQLKPSPLQPDSSFYETTRKSAGPTAMAASTEVGAWDAGATITSSPAWEAGATRTSAAAWEAGATSTAAMEAGAKSGNGPATGGDE